MSATYRDALRAALLYLLLSAVWLQVSGYLLNSFFDSSAERLRWQLINGYVWGLFSAGLIFIARARLLRCLGGGDKLRERDADRMHLAHHDPLTGLPNRLLFTDRANTSIGISLFPGDALSVEQLLRNADSALFKAKSTGRNDYALYTEELTAHAQQRVEIAFELRRALDRQELRVYYQPVHDLKTRRLIGVEALVRWQHPQRGLVSPAEFIPVAERTGLIAEIDAWVMAQACRQMCQWQQGGVVLSFVAVNVSSRLFARRELYQQVAQVLRETGLEPAFLELEVTESAVMEDPEVALEQMHRLRELGVRLAIDDFGTGYSSLLRLKRLPVQKLKIDQGFVAGLPWDEDDAAISRVIIALAQSMGMRVHAEGVEQAEQAAFLLEHDCDLGQGYWFGRPVPATQLDWTHAPVIT